MPPRLDPAPPRGRYDRNLPSQTRQARQAERLLQATLQAIAEHGEHATVTHVVAAARVGRNTFYEHFADMDAAVERACARGVGLLRERMVRSLADAWTPRERLRSALGAWTGFVGEQPGYARALLRLPAPQAHSVLSRAGEPLRDVLRELLAEARRDAAIAIAPDEARLVAATAAVEAIGRWRVEQPWSREDDAELAADLVLRAFR